MTSLPFTVQVYPEQKVVCLEADQTSYADLDVQQAMFLASELIGAAMVLDRRAVLDNMTSMLTDIIIH